MLASYTSGGPKWGTDGPTTKVQLRNKLRKFARSGGRGTVPLQYLLRTHTHTPLIPCYTITLNTWSPLYPQRRTTERSNLRAVFRVTVSVPRRSPARPPQSPLRCWLTGWHGCPTTAWHDDVVARCALRVPMHLNHPEYTRAVQAPLAVARHGVAPSLNWCPVTKWM